MKYIVQVGVYLFSRCTRERFFGLFLERVYWLRQGGRSGQSRGVLQGTSCVDDTLFRL